MYFSRFFRSKEVVIHASLGDMNVLFGRKGQRRESEKTFSVLNKLLFFYPSLLGPLSSKHGLKLMDNQDLLEFQE
jgi:hypothetical protein